MNLCYVPALFETTVNFDDPFAKSAAINFSGIPHNPKPPTSNLAPSGMSATVSSIFSYILDVLLLPVE